MEVNSNLNQTNKRAHFLASTRLPNATANQKARKMATQQTAQALGRAMHANRNNAKPAASGAQSNTDSSNITMVQTVWQHPFVDVFKHFKILPVQDWKANKRQGDVQEAFAREIGRKVMCLSGSISANNYIQMPHPNSMTRTLGLTGRYVYLQVKAPISSVPFSFHIDLNMCERSTGIRLSASNLYKQVSTQNGFVMQIPLNLDVDRWTVIVLDVVNLLKMSRLLPANYVIEGSYQIKGMTLCANSMVRGVFTSDNEYDFVTLPPDMRFKFSFDINRWPEYFAWLELPSDIRAGATDSQLAEERTRQVSAKAALKAQNQGSHMTDQQKKQMQAEIDQLLTHQRLTTTNREGAETGTDKNAKYEAMQAEMAALLGPKGGHSGDDMLSPDELLGFQGNTEVSAQRIENASNRGLNVRGLPSSHSNASNPYQAGMYIGEAPTKVNPKLNQDPIMELKHIIGYSPAKCLNLRWSRIANENIVLFTSCGSLIAMDVETNRQVRFFFGHSAPICCFDVSQSGNLIASAQEGKNSIIRIWDYHNARCLQMLTMPVTQLQCVSFSPDGRYLACVGKEGAAKRYGKEMIIVWDISRIAKGEKAEILAKQVSEFNIIQLKFSPIDNYKLISCGKQNIRFWRIKETRNIRGSAVVLNQFARDTVFTCLDFELSGMRSGPETIVQESAQNKKGKDGLRRVYVASKTGMVYQINYDDEVLEATYRTNDSAIYSIAINQAFCVTGSEDQYLRIWALDFNEFLMEAKHEGTVCSVDISADGLKVACGTLNGSLGVLNKSNQRYQTLLRSHTASIVSMDFHLAKRNVITVSHDDTIRLWDLQTFDQVVEFSSPIDQPLCVAAHPTLPIFSCGFQSGTMRVFDIEKTCVCDNFTQFNKPIKAIQYSPNGDILVTCCVDGSVALHNARRQHLPTKILNLEFAPQFVHVAFSQPIVSRRQNAFNRNVYLKDLNQMGSDQDMSSQHDQPSQSEDNLSVEEETTYVESMFAIMGEYGNNIMIYSSDSIILKHQIQVGCVIRSFQFTKNNREIIVVTHDQRIRVYSLATFEGAYLRELHTVHKGAVTCTDLSQNGGYMLTGGQDNLLKMWDYDAQKTVPFYFQAFIGHTYPLVSTMFNPLDNGMVISAAENDGIYIWEFHGDTATNYHPAADDAVELAPTSQYERDALHEPTVLERMRISVKEKRKPKLAEFSFIVPEFKVQQFEDTKLFSLGIKAKAEDTTGILGYYQAQVAERELSFNTFISVKDMLNIDVQIEKGPSFAAEGQGKMIEPITVNGYDGFGGVHDNLIWSPSSGMITYTLHNKIILESTKTRGQTVITESEVRLSCLARSPNERILAAAEGEASRLGNANIYLIDLSQNKLMNKITFFHHGVQSMAFSNCGRFLIANSVAEENCLVILDVNSGLVCEGGTVILREESINKIVVNPYSEGDVDFITIGQKGNFIIWKYDYEMQRILNIQPEMNQDLQNTDFTSACFTPKMPAPYNCELVILGSADGAVAAVNPNPQDANNIRKLDWVEHGKKEFILGEAISSIIYRHSQVVISGSQGSIVRYADKSAQIMPPDDRDMITRIKTEDPIVATQMDDQNNEGIIGTSDCTIKYIQFNDESHPVVKLVQKVSPFLDSVDILKFDHTNRNVFLSGTGKHQGDIKLLTAGMIDHIYTFPQYAFGPVAFVSASPKDKKNRMIGHASGFIKIVAINALKETSLYKIDMQEGETLTCGTYSPSGHNFAVGTSYGAIYLGMLKKDPMQNNKTNAFMARVDTVSHGNQNAVTSIQLTAFNPQGNILAAFDNGQVRCWQSTIKHEVYMKLQEMKSSSKKSRKKEAFELSVLGEIQFDVVDKFDMFENPHGVDDLTEQEAENLSQLYGGKTYSDCEAVFNNAGSSGVDHYFCYVSALQYIFVRNYNLNETVKKISLMHFPTKLHIMEYNRLAIEAGLKELSRIGIASLVAVGTKEGKVLIYRLDSNEAKLLLKTKSGVVYGNVTSLSIQDNGQNFVVGSSTGEVLSFQLLNNLVGLEE